MERACITGMTGYKDNGCSVNVQGEQQKKLDVITNDVLKNALRFTGRLSVLASEEEDVPVNVDNSDVYKHKRHTDVVVEEGNKVRAWMLGLTLPPPFQRDLILTHVYTSILRKTKQYVAVFDPLDGSSNVDASIPVGTIFGMCVPCSYLMHLYLSVLLFESFEAQPLDRSVDSSGVLRVNRQL